MEDCIYQPVKEIDPTTNYYGQSKVVIPVMKRAIDRGFANSDLNLLNETDNKMVSQGDLRKNDRMNAMKRRTQQAM